MKWIRAMRVFLLGNLVSCVAAAVTAKLPPATATGIAIFLSMMILLSLFKGRRQE